MHVLQWIAVKDESKEDAIAHVRNNLESYMGDDYSSGMWYDWFVVGGGRFNVPKDEGFEEAYKENKTNMIISLEEHGEYEFTNRVNKCIESRIREFGNYRKSFVEANININDSLDSYDGTTDYSFKLYPLAKMIDMLQGEWDFNSYFFDMDAHSTNPKFMLDKLAAGDVNWYLVPVDFHF